MKRRESIHKRYGPDMNACINGHINCWTEEGVATYLKSLVMVCSREVTISANLTIYKGMAIHQSNE